MRLGQCNAMNGASRCIRDRHHWWTAHWSYGKRSFMWYWWSKTRRSTNTRLALKYARRDPDGRLGG